MKILFQKILFKILKEQKFTINTDLSGMYVTTATMPMINEHSVLLRNEVVKFNKNGEDCQYASFSYIIKKSLQTSIVVNNCGRGHK